MQSARGGLDVMATKVSLRRDSIKHGRASICSEDVMGFVQINREIVLQAVLRQNLEPYIARPLSRANRNMYFCCDSLIVTISMSQARRTV
jgi:hypothetical protein